MKGEYIVIDLAKGQWENESCRIALVTIGVYQYLFVKLDKGDYYDWFSISHKEAKSYLEYNPTEHLEYHYQSGKNFTVLKKVDAILKKGLSDLCEIEDISHVVIRYQDIRYKADSQLLDVPTTLVWIGDSKTPTYIMSKQSIMLTLIEDCILRGIKSQEERFDFYGDLDWKDIITNAFAAWKAVWIPLPTNKTQALLCGFSDGLHPQVFSIVPFKRKEKYDRDVAIQNATYFLAQGMLADEGIK